MADPVEKGGISAIAQRNIAAIVGLLAIIGAIYTGISGFNSWEYRIKQLEANQIEFASSIKQLNGNISELNLTLREIQIEQKYSRRDNRDSSIQ